RHRELPGVPWGMVEGCPADGNDQNQGQKAPEDKADDLTGWLAEDLRHGPVDAGERWRFNLLQGRMVASCHDIFRSGLRHRLPEVRRSRAACDPNVWMRTFAPPKYCA